LENDDHESEEPGNISGRHLRVWKENRDYQNISPKHISSSLENG
jgi:hypothetical protein